MWTKRFWLDAFERAIKTAAQGLVGAGITTAAVSDGGVDWKWTFIGAGIAAGLSLLTSIAGSQIGNPESASMLPASEEP